VAPDYAGVWGVERSGATGAAGDEVHRPATTETKSLGRYHSGPVNISHDRRRGVIAGHDRRCRVNGWCRVDWSRRDIRRSSVAVARRHINRLGRCGARRKREGSCPENELSSSHSPFLCCAIAFVARLFNECRG